MLEDTKSGVNLVIRGEDLFASTCAQKCLAEKLDIYDFSKIHFIHHPLLLDDKKQKLSKSRLNVSDGSGPIYLSWALGDIYREFSKFFMLEDSVTSAEDLLKMII